MFSPYLLVGFNGNYSIYENPLFDFVIDENNEYWGYNFGGPVIQQFNIGYSTAIGVNYKAVFLELNYRILPDIKFGKFEDPTGFFVLKVGIDLPFNNEGPLKSR